MKSLKTILLAGVVALVASSGVAVAQYVTKNYEAQGGALWVVGGQLEVTQGGQLLVDKAAVSVNSGNSYTATANQAAAVVTTDSLATAAGSSRTITLNDNLASASSACQVSVNGGTNTAGTPILKCVPGAGTLTITLSNNHASAAFNGTFVLAVGVS